MIVPDPDVQRTAKYHSAGSANDTGAEMVVDMLRPTVSDPLLLFEYFPMTVPVPEATAAVGPITTSAELFVPALSDRGALDVMLMLTIAGRPGVVA